MPIETVFLDAGGVLLFPNWAKVSQVLAEHGVVVGDDVLTRADYRARRRLDVGDTIEATTDESRSWLYFDLVLTEADVPLSLSTKASLEQLHRYHRQQNLWERVPAGVVGALKALRALGLRLTVVSNANGTLCAHLDRLDLTQWFHCVLDSHDLGVEKPDPRMFQMALERSGATAGTTIHVGDLYHVDVVGARAAGLRGVLFDEAGLYPEADCPRVGSLAELVKGLEDGRFE